MRFGFVVVCVVLVCVGAALLEGGGVVWVGSGTSGWSDMAICLETSKPFLYICEYPFHAALCMALLFELLGQYHYFSF